MRVPRVLIYGYGNPGRSDDGLGNAFVELASEWILKEGIRNIDTDSNYQLNIEDAELIHHYDIVIFVDASCENEFDGFQFSRLQPASDSKQISTHSVTPSFVLHLSEEIYKAQPEAYLLRIKGYQWEFIEQLSDKADENLRKAFDHLKNTMNENSWAAKS